MMRGTTGKSFLMLARQFGIGAGLKYIVRNSDMTSGFLAIGREARHTIKTG